MRSARCSGVSLSVLEVYDALFEIMRAGVPSLSEDLSNHDT